VVTTLVENRVRTSLAASLKVSVATLAHLITDVKATIVTETMIPKICPAP